MEHAIIAHRRKCTNTAECEEKLRIQGARLEEYQRKMEDAFASVMSLIATIVEIRDSYTFGHSLRVSNLSCSLAKRIGFSDDMIKSLGQACLVHDIGKVRTSDAVLLKPGRLSDAEIIVMRRHPEDGAEILNRIPVFRKYLPVIKSHHERFDGRGYPQGLEGENIPIPARIVAIADAYDAMTTTRPYREALTMTAALEEIMVCRGTQFDPDMGGLFVEMLEGPK